MHWRAWSSCCVSQQAVKAASRRERWRRRAAADGKVAATEDHCYSSRVLSAKKCIGLSGHGNEAEVCRLDFIPRTEAAELLVASMDKSHGHLLPGNTCLLRQEREPVPSQSVEPRWQCVFTAE